MRVIKASVLTNSSSTSFLSALRCCRRGAVGAPLGLRELLLVGLAHVIDRDLAAVDLRRVVGAAKVQLMPQKMKDPAIAPSTT
jgi:hypothetical protein